MYMMKLHLTEMRFFDRNKILRHPYLFSMESNQNTINTFFYHLEKNKTFNYYLLV